MNRKTINNSKLNGASCKLAYIWALGASSGQRGANRQETRMLAVKHLT